MNEIYQRLKDLCKINNTNITSLCIEVTGSGGNTTTWAKGNIRTDYLIKIANKFDVSVDYILGKSDTIEKAPAKKGRGIKIPVLGEVPAGIPIEAVEDIVDYEEITPEMARSGDHFALQIKGDSMSPRIVTGDVVIVRKQDYAETGDTVIALINGNEATCKKIKITEKGWTLISLNPVYDPMFFSAKEVAELPVQILGKVVELRGKF